MPDDQPLDPQAAAHIARVRRLMMIASATTFLALAVVLAVIGYRLFKLGGSAPAPNANIAAALPAGAEVVSTAIGDGRLAVTIKKSGCLETRLYDLKTLQAAGRLDLGCPP